MEENVTGCSSCGAQQVTIQPGYVITDDGVMRKILGELRITGDGCVIGNNAMTYWDGPGGVHKNKWKLVNQTNNWKRECDVFSSEDAAKSV